MSLLVTGFFLSLFLHFLIYSDKSTAWNYLLYIFKVLFFRNCPRYGIRTFSEYYARIVDYFFYNPHIILVNSILGFTVILGVIKKWVAIGKKPLISFILIVLIAYADIIICTRLIPRDTIWKETLLNLMSVVFCAVLIRYSLRYKRSACIWGLALLSWLLAANITYARRMPDRLDGHYNHFFWDKNRWPRANLRGEHLLYEKIMRNTYLNYNDHLMNRAWEEALDYKQNRCIVEYVFKNQQINHTHIGVADYGFPVWVSLPQYRIHKIPDSLTGAILVDNGSLPLEKEVSFKKEYVLEQSEYFDKISSNSSEASLVVLNRLDLKIFLFMESEYIPLLKGKYLKPSALKLSVTDGRNSMELTGVEVTNYTEIPVSQLAGKYVFVIQEI